jgi:uncharacterized protein (DUF885 family)
MSLRPKAAQRQRPVLRAPRQLGAEFDTRALRGVMLGSGAVSLGVLDQIVTRRGKEEPAY